MILPAQKIFQRCIDKYSESVRKDALITPFEDKKQVANGKSYGLSHAGYDIRVKLPSNWDSITLQRGDFLLASSVERIKMPNDLLCIVHDKSSWAREGLALQNTVLEPGWEGWITLEITAHRGDVVLRNGDPIAQLIFHQLIEPTNNPYVGKYQNQPDEAVESIQEESVRPITAEDIPSEQKKMSDFY